MRMPLIKRNDLQVLWKPVFFLILLVATRPSQSQVFENQELQQKLWKSAYHIYNAERDSVFFKLDQIEPEVPDHPVIPLMKAMGILWSTIPLISEEDFLSFQEYLRTAIRFAEDKDPEMEDPEMVFFAMGAHGLLAEYYADKGWYLKAAGEAKTAYSLIKKGFGFVDEHPEFLLTVGLYNYFRERYPEQYPIYRPLLWFFKDGDKQLGLEQLKLAADGSLFIEVEANVYLSYIYLRYEFEPAQAQAYLQTLCENYPNSYYAKAKYLESIATQEDFHQVDTVVLNALSDHESLYYRLAGNVFWGYFYEVVKSNKQKAIAHYELGLGYGAEIPHHGEYFKSFGNLGLGRLLKEEDPSSSKKYLEEALKYAETVSVKREAKKILASFE